MKIHLKSILTAKWRIVLAASTITIVIIGAVLVYLFAIMHASNTTSSVTPSGTRPGQVAAIPRQSSANKKISVISPVNVINDAFKGYELNKDSEAEAPADDAHMAGQGNSTAEEVSKELAGQPPQIDKTAQKALAVMKQERAREGTISHRIPAVGISSVSQSSTSAKDEASVVGSVVHDEGIKQLNERLDETGLSEPNRKRLIQSYLDLRKVLPEKEAQKMIMWKIVHEKK
jgi:hypothetical protein